MSNIESLIRDYGLIIILLSTFVEQLGLPLPSYPVLLVAGSLTLTAGNSPLSIIILGCAGALLGDTLCYAVGRRFGRRTLALVCKISLSPDSCVRRTEATFLRLGPWTLLFAKFVPGLALVTVVMCGITRLSVPLFLVADGIGAAIYVALPVFLGRIFHDAIDAILAALTQWGVYGTVLVVSAVALYVALRWYNRWLFIRRLRMGRISVPELERLIEKGPPPIILDVRSADSRRRQGVIPGAIGAGLSEVTAILKNYPHDAAIIIYCSCPNEASAATAALEVKRAGFKNIRPLLGGIDAWTAAGNQVERS